MLVRHRTKPRANKLVIAKPLAITRSMASAAVSTRIGVGAPSATEQSHATTPPGLALTVRSEPDNRRVLLAAAKDATTTVPLETVAITAGAVVLAALIAAIAAHLRLKRQLAAEQTRLDAQLNAERERLQLQLHDGRVDELRAVFENAALAFLQAATDLRLVLHGDQRPLDFAAHLTQLQANQARVAVRLGTGSDITSVYSAAAQKWAEAVHAAASPPPGEDAAGVEARKERIAAAFNEAHDLSRRFNDMAAQVIGPAIGQT